MQVELMTKMECIYVQKMGQEKYDNMIVLLMTDSYPSWSRFPWYYKVCNLY